MKNVRFCRILNFRSILSDFAKCHKMGWYPNKWAKVGDVSGFSVTGYYEKVCVPEGVIPIVIDVPRLRHVGASWGGRIRLYRRNAPTRCPAST